MEKTLEIENKTEGIKLHSIRAINLATFFGGPLASSYLNYENFKNLGDAEKAKNALLIGIGFTIFLISFIFIIPDFIDEKLPTHLIPAVYTLISWGLIDKYAGNTLKNHKKLGNPLYSGWRAFLIAIISAIIFIGSILTIDYLFFRDASIIEFNEKIDLFYEKEDEALNYKDKLNTETNYSLIKEIENVSLREWEENIQLAKEMISIPTLPSDQLKQAKALLEYTELRKKEATLIKTYLQSESDELGSEIQNVIKEIDIIINRFGSQ